MARLSKIKRQHTNYSDKTIKRALELLKNNTIQNVHQNTKIPISTLRTWKSKEDKSQKLDDEDLTEIYLESHTNVEKKTENNGDMEIDQENAAESNKLEINQSFSEMIDNDEKKTENISEREIDQENAAHVLNAAEIKKEDESEIDKKNNEMEIEIKDAIETETVIVINEEDEKKEEKKEENELKQEKKGEIEIAIDLMVNMKSRNEVLQFKNISVSKRKFKLVKFSAEMIVQPGTPQILPAQSFLDQIKEKKPDLKSFVVEVQNLYYDAERTLLLQKIFDLKDLKIRVQKEMEWLKKLTKEKNILTQDFISEDTINKFTNIIHSHPKDELLTLFLKKNILITPNELADLCDLFWQSISLVEVMNMVIKNYVDDETIEILFQDSHNKSQDQINKKFGKQKYFTSMNVNQNHWVGLLIDTKDKEIKCYDGYNESIQKEVINYTTKIWKGFKVHHIANPPQLDTSSCGFLASLFLYKELTGIEIPATKKNVAGIRGFFLEEIIKALKN